MRSHKQYRPFTILILAILATLLISILFSGCCSSSNGTSIMDVADTVHHHGSPCPIDWGVVAKDGRHMWRVTILAGGSCFVSGEAGNSLKVQVEDLDGLQVISDDLIELGTVDTGVDWHAQEYLSTAAAGPVELEIHNTSSSTQEVRIAVLNR